MGQRGGPPGIRYEIDLKAELAPPILAVGGVSSREGAGTTFTLSFPAITAEAARPPAFLPSLESLRILAVEDEPEVLDVVRAMMASAGHTVVSVASGREALELFEREPVGVVVTDLGMPSMTGLAPDEEVKRRRPVPVLLLTGWADELAAAHACHLDVLLAERVTRESLVGGSAKAVPDRVRPG